jgi:hypothetical protein
MEITEKAEYFTDALYFANLIRQDPKHLEES